MSDKHGNATGRGGPRVRQCDRGKGESELFHFGDILLSWRRRASSVTFVATSDMSRERGKKRRSPSPVLNNSVLLLERSHVHTRHPEQFKPNEFLSRTSKTNYFSNTFKKERLTVITLVKKVLRFCAQPLGNRFSASFKRPRFTSSRRRDGSVSRDLG